jgi:CubicO group peptidase (beta-lactamase class C family)
MRTSEPILPISTADPESVGFCAARLQRITDVFEREVEGGGIPGAVVVVARRGHITYLKEFGFRDAAEQAPMQIDSVFRIASMTKPITCVAAMMLVEEGYFPLATPVSRYIPGFADLKVGCERSDGGAGEVTLFTEPLVREVTVQDLMRHTSGLTYGDFGDSLVQQAYRGLNMMDAGQTNEEMVQKLCTLPLRYQPGTTFEYGMSIDVLGRLIEIVSGTDLNTFITERITRPLGMQDTSFVLSPDKQKRLALPFVNFTSFLEKATASPVAPAARWHMGGGGLISCALDYLRFALMLLHGGELNGARLLSRETVKFMTSDHLPPNADFGSGIASFGSVAPTPQMGQSFGLGFAVRTAQGRNPDLGSVGMFFWPGISGTAFWVDPAQELVVVLMLQAPSVRAHYRSLLRNLVYQAIVD